MKSLKTILFTSVLVFGVVRSQAQTFVTNGLICYYSFDGNTLDSSGHGNNPTKVIATPAPDRFGNPLNALAFNGVNSGIVDSGFYLQSSNFPGYYTQPLTESIWFCPSNNLDGGSTPFTLICDGGSGGAQYSTTLYNGGNGLQAYYYTPFNNQELANSSVTNFASNVWYQAVGVFTATNVQVYVNGVLTGSSTFGATYDRPYSDLNIGAQQWSNGAGYRFGFAGRLDDVRIYNRGLSSNEVSQLYALEAPPTPTLGLAYAYVPTFANLTSGASYQLQTSTDANGTFTNYGPTFAATNSTMNYSGYFLVTNSPQLYFRLSQ